MDFLYTVYAGGIEVNDYMLTEEQAHDLANEFVDAGYDDVSIAIENIWNGAYTWINFDKKGISAFTKGSK